MFLHIALKRANYRGDLGQIQPDPANIRNSGFLPSWKNQENLENGQNDSMHGKIMEFYILGKKLEKSWNFKNFRKFGSWKII